MTFNELYKQAREWALNGHCEILDPIVVRDVDGEWHVRSGVTYKADDGDLLTTLEHFNNYCGGIYSECDELGADRTAEAGFVAELLEQSVADN